MSLEQEIQDLYKRMNMKMPKNPVVSSFNHIVNGKDTGERFIFGVGVLPNKRSKK